MSRAALLHVMNEVIRRNHLRNCSVYVQVTRGVAPRDHKFPKGIKPSLLVMARTWKAPAAGAAGEGRSRRHHARSALGAA